MMGFLEEPSIRLGGLPITGPPHSLGVTAAEKTKRHGAKHEIDTTHARGAEPACESVDNPFEGRTTSKKISAGRALERAGEYNGLYLSRAQSCGRNEGTACL